jgi:hypothetical protein
MNRTASYLFILYVCFGCTRYLSEPELRTYVTDPGNGLTGEVKKGDVRIAVNYRPADLVMFKDLQMITDEDQREAAVKRYDSINYFVMQLSMNDREIESIYAGDPRKFGEVVSYLSYGIANDLILIADKDTINALDVAYSRSFGSAGSTQLMVAFKGDLRRRSGTARLLFDDNALGTGISEFEFDCDKLRETPRIKFP